MIKFKKDTKTGNYDVIGPADELRLGPATVTKRDGSTTDVTVTKLSSVFEGRFDDLEGVPCVIGTIQPMPRQRGGGGGGGGGRDY